jgi:aldose 1-epimerase
MSDPVRDQRFLLLSPSGVTALLSTWGANLVSLTMPDRDGRFDDVVLGYDSPAEYLVNSGFYFGCTVGRVANRIKSARFSLDGVDYQLAVNNGPNHLHGGDERSFDRVEWAGRRVASAHGETVEFRYSSPDGEEGYPGNLDTMVTYTLTRSDELLVEYLARTDRRTPVNLTNHTYWNLAGAGAPTILDHELRVDADRFTPADDEQIPLGTFAPVAGTGLDFREPARLGPRIAEFDSTAAGGFDHNLVFRDGRSVAEPAVILRDPASGRVLEMMTQQPCVQLYSGNFLSDTAGKGGRIYRRRSGVCLEAQVAPDAVHNPQFGSIMLEPGAEYRHTITYRLRTDRRS